jgi:hypothetical protein
MGCGGLRVVAEGPKPAPVRALGDAVVKVAVELDGANLASSDARPRGRRGR